jgi:nicotinamidase-related amidase
LAFGQAAKPQNVTLIPQRTALLALDFTSGPCGSRPRCLASLPAEAHLIARARAHRMMVVYSVAPGETAANILAPVAPSAGDPVVESGPDKFVGTNLASILAAAGVTTVIVTGTAAEGAVLDTGLDAGLREGLQVVVPEDLVTSSVYAETYVAWDFANAPGISARAVVTRSGLLGF